MDLQRKYEALLEQLVYGYDYPSSEEALNRALTMFPPETLSDWHELEALTKLCVLERQKAFQDLAARQAKYYADHPEERDNDADMLLASS